MIRPAMEQWRGISLELLKLAQDVSDDRRDAVIEDVDRLLDERDRLQQDIQPPFTPEEEALGKELVGLEQRVLAALTDFTKAIRSDITAAQSKKENMKSYVNPYAKVGRDGMFYDTKQ